MEHMDFWDALHRQMDKSGFYLMGDREMNIYYRIENPVFYLIYFLDKADPSYGQKEEDFTDYAQQIQKRLRPVQCTRLVALSVLVDNSDVDRAVDNVDNVDNRTGISENAFFGAEDAFFRIHWELSPQRGVTARPGQPDRLIGIEKLLSAAARGEAPEELPLEKPDEGFPTVTAAIFLVWLILLGWMLFSGQRNEIIAAYGLARRGVLAGGYYRFVTSMFLHTGLAHLLSNGIYLYYFGTRAELLLGKARFLLLYMAAGLCGGLCSILFSGGLAVGASGAIFGLLGAMLLLTRKRGARAAGISYSTMLILMAAMLGFGFLDPLVDNFAHIGGLLGGCAVFWLMMRKK